MPGVLITGMLQFFILDTCWPQWNPRTEGDDLKALTEKRAASSQPKERINTGVKAGLWPLSKLGAWGKHMRWFTAGQDSLNQKGGLKEADSTFLCSVVRSWEQACSAFGGLFCPRQSQKGWNDPETGDMCGSQPQQGRDLESEVVPRRVGSAGRRRRKEGHLLPLDTADWFGWKDGST